MDAYRSVESFIDLASSRVSKSDLYNKNQFTVPFHGNPIKLQNALKSQLEQMGYTVKINEFKKQAGEFSEQILDITVNIYAEKRKDVKGKIFSEKKYITLPVIIIGAVLLFISFAAHSFFPLALLLLAAGALLLYFEPAQKIFTYLPAGNCIWIFCDGQAYLGTKAEEVSEKASKKSGATRSIQVTYIKGDIEIFVANESAVMNEFYNQKLLRDKEKTKFTFSDVLFALLRGKKYISLESEEEYAKLVNTEDVSKSYVADMDILRKKFSKFSDMH